MENGMILLTISATLTSLMTEAIKKLISVDSKKVSLNALVAVVSVICSLLVSFGYIVLAHLTMSPQIVVYIVALVVLTFLVSTCGYDKVIQLLKQIDFTKINKGGM